MGHVLPRRTKIFLIIFYSISRFRIGLSFIKCDWGQCKEGYLGQGPQDFKDGKFEISINGEPVIKMMTYHDEYTQFLKGRDGYTWKPDPNTQDYEIAIRIKESGSFVQIGTIYLF